MKLYSEACERNKGPISEVLRSHLPDSPKVLEIASGSGQHAIWFANRIDGVKWQPTDIDEASIVSIKAMIKDEGQGIPILPPILLDVTNTEYETTVDAMVNINMIHISPWATCESLFQKAQKWLNKNGVLFLYGPFIFDDVETAPSNITFDASLRQRNPQWGIREYEKVKEVAKKSGFRADEIISMPANNYSLIFRRLGDK